MLRGVGPRPCQIGRWRLGLALGFGRKSRSWSYPLVCGNNRSRKLWLGNDDDFIACLFVREKLKLHLRAGKEQVQVVHASDEMDGNGAMLNAGGGNDP